MALNIKKLNYVQLIDTLISSLPERERDVLVQRYCLKSGLQKKATLEKIGSDYNITRERVRQIENDALKKINETLQENNLTLIKDLMKSIEMLLEQHGGFIGQDHMISYLLQADQSDEAKLVEFILEKVASAQYNTFEKTAHDIIWHTDEISQEQILELVQAVSSILEKNDNPLNFEEVVENLKAKAQYKTIDAMSAENHYIIEALLRARADVKKNILNQWGKSEWTTITPKRMTDKAYLILQREGRPLHFEECADLINTSNFDKKKACAATVHNELIMDNKYVLVGRGMYALKDWGYQEGTVADIIAKILKENGDLDKDAINAEVLKQRFVKKTTIMLALMNKKMFEKKTDGKYALK